MLTRCASGELAPQQLACATFGVSRWEESNDGPQNTRDYVRQKLGAIMQGQELDLSNPPPLDLLCRHFSQVRDIKS